MQTYIAALVLILLAFVVPVYCYEGYLEVHPFTGRRRMPQWLIVVVLWASLAQVAASIALAGLVLRG